MPNYIVNKDAQSNGDYEVHDETSTRGCLPAAANRISLGYHSSCLSAVAAAKNAGYRSANGCSRCALSCHTS
ncbi:hypothetical protein C5C00_12300 [Rathayibacter rathayi]|nr:hypothetical protein C5C47_12155 [Rathayibacter rathayi]PPG94357.1 hypothetical protein C5C00_12300 [Rathayibacter rathayi]